MSESSVGQQILDTAIGLAEAKGWKSVRLREVAERLAISLDDIRAQFSEEGQLVDAGLDRANSVDGIGRDDGLEPPKHTDPQTGSQEVKMIGDLSDLVLAKVTSQDALGPIWREHEIL